jgi:HAD superfamily hydrolase (TIGR01509 family)
MDGAMSDEVRTLLIDVDGTLVDSNYEHVLAWLDAFRRLGVDVPAWRLHRHIGMGGDQLVPAVAGEEVEDRLGDQVREAEGRAYRRYLPRVHAFSDARRFLRGCHDRGLTVVLVSSAKTHELERYRSLLAADPWIDAWIGATDVEATKPAPDLVSEALEAAGASPSEALMLGDSTWDVVSAARAGVPAVGLLTGGYGPQELLDAGALDVFEDLDGLAAGSSRLLSSYRASA